MTLSDALPIIVFALSYLLGSVPFGLVLCYVAGYGDIRKIGSGNIGTTNVLRTGNRLLAALTLICDSGKGAASVLLAVALLPDHPSVAAAAAWGSFLGHLYPVWLKFKGGKGVATTLGILIALQWQVGLAAVGTWLAVAFVFKYSSLSALVAIAAAPVVAFFVGGQTLALIALPITALVWVKHKANIQRLLKGEESKIKLKKTPQVAA